MNNGQDAAAAVVRWQAGHCEQGRDRVARECAVALVYNGIAHAVMMMTPDYLADFALGFSLSEGLVETPDELYSVDIETCERGIEIAMTLSARRFAALKDTRRNLTGRTGCGLCGALSLEQAVREPRRVQNDFYFSHAALQRAVAQLDAHQPLQALTGAVHAAAWCDARGAIVLVREDVGRHNALDKLIGALARQSRSAGFLLLSSRASYEMVVKAASAGVQMMAAMSAPTALAIELADCAGITLVGFARPGRHSIYTHPQRLREEA